MKARLKFIIDGRECLSEEGESLLQAALNSGIYIPHLCDTAENDDSPAACRLCFVEIEGRTQPVTACTEAVREGMVVHTRGRNADRLVRTAFALIMSSHRTDCLNFPVNGGCDLQRIARERKLPLKSVHLPVISPGFAVDDSIGGILFDPGKCVLCGRCITACREKGTGILGFSGKGIQRKISVFGGGTLAAGGCCGCGSCTAVCPSGSFTARL